MPNVEVVSLIFRSVQYLNFMVSQLKSEFCEVDGWDVGVRIVGNDPTQEVIDELKKIDIPYDIFINLNREEYYLNRVYRAYNYCITSSKYENICLVNSDMAFSKDWLKNLLKYYDGINIPCSRLVESGKKVSGQWALNMGNAHFGRHPKDLRMKDWLQFAEIIKENITKPGGLYMPCVLNKQRIIEAGLYPNGNIYVDGVGTCNGYPVRAGDDYFFHDVLEKKFGMKHITIFNSLVYHIIEGEFSE